MFATVASVSLFGLHGIQVGVEADIQTGLPSFEIVGLPASAIREAKERVRSAILNSGYVWPRSRITISLTPADFRKDGSGLDLPIAIAILVSSEQILPVANRAVLLGELALDGAVRTFRGLYAALSFALDMPHPMIIVPDSGEQSDELPLYQRMHMVENLSQAISILSGKQIPTKEHHLEITTITSFRKNYSEVLGQENVKRVLEIAATGHHHLIMYGTPGAGKTMLAERLPTILPPLDATEKAQVKKIYSVAGLPYPPENERPYRSPHHTISTSGLLGGGSTPRPGEVSLAHQGVLFLDEFPEFSRSAIEGLRQPLSIGEITISRSLYSYSFPSKFQLVAAMNPCPCGYYGSNTHPCTCSAQSIEMYQRKLSGPILDRIDLSVWVDGVPLRKIWESPSPTEDSSTIIRNRVLKSKTYAVARVIEHQELKKDGISIHQLEMDNHTVEIFIRFAESHHLSMRGADKLSRVARTIADIDQSEWIKKEHLLEAMQYRMLQSDNRTN